MMKKRYDILDSLRGLTLISMILYHAMWDIVYIYGVDAPWYESQGAYIWQQSICWTFILLSGFCWSMGRRHLKRGLVVFGLSVLISVVTLVVMPESRILFGVLSLIGTAMIVMIPLDKLLRKVNPFVGMIVAFLLFAVTRNVPSGALGFENWHIMALPEELYRNLFTAYLGFPSNSFFSTDYFSVIPWIFLYITGYFLYHIFERKEWLKIFTKKGATPLSFLGRHSLIIYVLHQLIIYGVLYLWFNIMENVLQ